MFQYRYGIKLAKTTADTAVLKLLRREFPNIPLVEHRRRVRAREPIYYSDQEESRFIALTRLPSLLERFDEAGVEVLLLEEQFCDGQWAPLPSCQSQLRAALGTRFQRVFQESVDSNAENLSQNQQTAITGETIVLVLDPGKLENPDLDLRYEVPEQVEAFTEGAVQDNGFSYLETPPDQPGPLMCLFLRTQRPAAEQWPRVLALLRERRFLGNDLSQSAELYLSPHPQVEPTDCVKVYPV